MRKPILMKVDCEQFLVDALMLDAAQTGFYVRLMMACWYAGGTLAWGSQPYTEEELRRIARASKHLWKQFFPRFEKLFERQSDGSWRCKALKDDRVYLEGVREIRRKAASKGGQKRWGWGHA